VLRKLSSVTVRSDFNHCHRARFFQAQERRRAFRLTEQLTADRHCVARPQQDFESRLAGQQKQIEALTAGVQKVSAQVEMSSAPQMAVNDQ
jgi:hypothetical protein